MYVNSGKIRICAVNSSGMISCVNVDLFVAITQYIHTQSFFSIPARIMQEMVGRVQSDDE
jgi:hypothetical protein